MSKDDKPDHSVDALRKLVHAQVQTALKGYIGSDITPELLVDLQATIAPLIAEIRPDLVISGIRPSPGSEDMVQVQLMYRPKETSEQRYKEMSCQTYQIINLMTT